MAYTEDEKLQIYTEATEPAPCAVHEYYRSLSLLQKIHGYRDADALYEQYAKEIKRLEDLAATGASYDNDDVKAYHAKQKKKSNLVTAFLVSLFSLSLLAFVLVLILTPQGYIIWPCLTLCVLIGVIVYTQVLRPALDARRYKKMQENEKNQK
jgi:Flp pilus assembly protein TadB